MALKSINPTQLSSWSKLTQHFKDIENVHMKDLFKSDSDRANNFTIKWEDFYVDYSKNRTLKHLVDLANQVDLKDAINKYFSGDIINQTENRAVLHTALRTTKDDEVFVDGKNVIPEVYSVKSKIEGFTNKVVNGELKGFTNKPFTDVVNIGIGGSDLGPAMVVDSLQYYKNQLTTHFVSNVDGDHVNEVIKKLDPETTLFVIVSKTFTTQETLSNSNTIKEWFLSRDIGTASSDAIAKHFVAVSTNIEKVKEFGIAEDNIFPMWDWVGGRFSLWSAVGLTISLAVGYKNFDALLKGAHKMDEHFKNEEFESNIPVILALISIWYNNFFKAESEVVIPYSQYLNQFATYLQQGIMESNGKSIDRNGKTINYQTGTIIWGEPGTNSQHAFFQLIHQGTKLIPADFIGFVSSLHGNKDHHDKLTSNYLAQTEALLNGKTKEEVLKELESTNLSQSEIATLLPFKIFNGNKPTNSIFINKLTPESLGKLIAMYEHKIFVQGIIWNIFSYDQFGVELGKQLASTLLKEINNTSENPHDSSTNNLLIHYKQNS